MVWAWRCGRSWLGRQAGSAEVILAVARLETFSIHPFNAQSLKTNLAFHTNEHQIMLLAIMFVEFPHGLYNHPSSNLGFVGFVARGNKELVLFLIHDCHSHTEFGHDQ